MRPAAVVVPCCVCVGVCVGLGLGVCVGLGVGVGGGQVALKRCGFGGLQPGQQRDTAPTNNGREP